jgi:uncharacterized protein involved in propanediol utilization
MMPSQAEAIGHAGELLQGALPISNHPEPFLVTLPAPTFRSVCHASPASAWTITPAWKTKALRAAQLAAAQWSFDAPLHLALTSTIPVARGCGSSTADCVAAVRAVARMLDIQPTPEQLANIVQTAEGASDSTMFPHPVAFLQSRGKVLRPLSGTWPAMHVTVIDLGGPNVHTLDCITPHYSTSEWQEFETLLDQLDTAMHSGDAPTVGRIATRSAEIHQTHRPHPNWPEIRELAAQHQSHGIARAHSGTIAAILSPHPLPVTALASFPLAL